MTYFVLFKSLVKFSIPCVPYKWLAYEWCDIKNNYSNVMQQLSLFTFKQIHNCCIHNGPVLLFDENWPGLATPATAVSCPARFNCVGVDSFELELRVSLFLGLCVCVFFFIFFVHLLAQVVLMPIFSAIRGRVYRSSACRRPTLTSAWHCLIVV